jgi:hypothetical protein
VVLDPPLTQKSESQKGSPDGDGAEVMARGQVDRRLDRIDLDRAQLPETADELVEDSAEVGVSSAKVLVEISRFARVPLTLSCEAAPALRAPPGQRRGGFLRGDAPAHGT